MKLLVVDLYSFVHAMLMIVAPPIIVFNPTTLPTYLGGEVLDPPKCFARIVRLFGMPNF
jgi:hypothetical protein